MYLIDAFLLNTSFNKNLDFPSLEYCIIELVNHIGLSFLYRRYFLKHLTKIHFVTLISHSLEEWKSLFIRLTFYARDILLSPFFCPAFNERILLILQTSLWSNLHPDQVIGTAAVVKNIDCSTATVDDIREVRSKFLSSIRGEGTRLCGFSGWFDVHFRVSWAPVHPYYGAC